MWPDLMGPGWERHLVATLGLLAAFIASLGLLASLASRREPESPDPLLVLLRRYEEGDLTRWEFERRRSALNHRERVRAARARWARTPASEPPAKSARSSAWGAISGSNPTEL